MTEIIGNIIIIIALVFITIGIIGIHKYKNFYTRILLSTKIDTVGAITLLIGIAVKHGISFFTFKIVILIAIMMILDPLTSHIVTRSAHECGYTPEGEDNNYDEGQV
jgi:multicomponent Na+:H+ antiporter subunit G